MITIRTPTREEVQHWRTVAENGETWAQFNLGQVYASGTVVAEDRREAVRWWCKAAEQGHVVAQYNLGVSYWFGIGVFEDKIEAVRWYRKAAEQGYAKAQFSVGVAYSNGVGVAKNKRESVRWFRKAAEQGDTSAQHNLGYAYAHGGGVATDKREAVRWYRKAAEQGYAKAQFNFGIAYNNGIGIAEDKREAARWFRKAAEQGHAAAQNNVGVAYSNGVGVAKNSREAIRWYRKAAEQGFADAQANLGVACWNGAGLIEDKSESYIWYSIAKANGSTAAANNLTKITWSDYLTQAEIRSARKEATHRLEAIDTQTQEKPQTPDIVDSIALAPKPKQTNIAAAVFEKTWRSVVMITSGNSQGGGVIIRSNVVATNYHVVASGGITVYKAKNRRVDIDIKFSATILYSDVDKDFCLLTVPNLRGVETKIRKYDTLEVGEDVYVLGAPKGLDLSLSTGVISQLRKLNGQQVIQTDAAISPGSSGGGLFDIEGNLIGITTSSHKGADVQGLNFAIPADLVLAY